jgi:IgA peptidase M64
MNTRTSVCAISVLSMMIQYAQAGSEPETRQDTESIVHCWPTENGDYTGTTTLEPVDPERAASYRGDQGFNAVTLLDNGLRDSHIDIVFVGDGYTVDELDDYRATVDSAVEQLFEVEPFKTYKHLFNIHRVDVISNESGIDNDPSRGIERDTALGMGFWCNNIQRAVCSDVLVTRAIAETYFEADQIVAIGNSPNRGGAASIGQNIAHVTSRPSSLAEVMIHELGHSLGRLADEYSTGGPANYPFPEPNEPNVSTLEIDEIVETQTKWFRWAGETFPEFDGLVGTFEGAHYSRFGIFRPSNRSRMRSSLSTQFNMPSVEAMVIKFYGPGQNIEWPLVADPNILTGHDAIARIEVNVPAGFDLVTRWRIDGEVVHVAGEREFHACEFQLQPGRHVIAVDVKDPTEWVRDEFQREQRLTSYRHWFIDIETYPADANGDGHINYFDLVFFINAYLAQDPATDIANPKGEFNFFDVLLFTNRLTNSCSP